MIVANKSANQTMNSFDFFLTFNFAIQNGMKTYHTNCLRFKPTEIYTYDVNKRENNAPVKFHNFKKRKKESTFIVTESSNKLTIRKN